MLQFSVLKLDYSTCLASDYAFPKVPVQRVLGNHCDRKGPFPLTKANPREPVQYECIEGLKLI